MIEYDDKGKIFTDIIRKAPTQVVIQTLTHQIQGEIYLRNEERLKDALNTSEPFLAVTNAIVYDSQGVVLKEADFLALNHEHILWVIPEDNSNPEQKG